MGTEATKMPSQDHEARETVGSPLRYPGGKFYALKYILPFVSHVKHDEYREPFLGGGAVFFAKKKVTHNWLNDLDANLISLYGVMADPEMRTEIISMLSREEASRSRHREVKQLDPRTLVESAFRTYYLNRTSFSGILNNPAWGYRPENSAPPKRWGEKIATAGRKLECVKLSAVDFEEVLDTPPVGTNLLYYLDPPYFGADQKRAYSKAFKLEDHLRLERRLRSMRHSFVLSYDDHPEIRRLYHWANIYERSWYYNTANSRGEARIVGLELIITNFKVPEVKQTKIEDAF